MPFASMRAQLTFGLTNMRTAMQHDSAAESKTHCLTCGAGTQDDAMCTAAYMQVDRQWYGTPLLWTRDDASGVWHSTEHVPALPKAIAAAPAAPAAAAQDQAPEAANGVTEQPGNGQPEAAKPAAPANGKQQGSQHPIVLASRAKMQQDKHSKAAAEAVADAAVTEAGAAAGTSSSEGSFREDVEEALKNCLVLVDVDIPLVALSDGVHARSFAGNGLVVYHGDNLGLVLVGVVGPCWAVACWAGA